MKTLFLVVKQFLYEEEGVTAIEYGLIAALIAVVLITGASLLGTNLNTLFDNIGKCLAAPATACSF